MDDTAQSSKKQDDTRQQGVSIQQITQAPPVQPSQPTQPVSLSHKEFAPAQATSEHEMVTPSDQKPTLHPEVAEAGVEVTPLQHTPKIHPDAAKAGLSLAKEATPVITTPTGIIKLPMTEEEAKKAKKAYGIKDSMRWRVELVLEQFKKAYRKLVN